MLLGWKSDKVFRLAYFVFALDVEQSLFFGHERSMLVHPSEPILRWYYL